MGPDVYIIRDATDKDWESISRLSAISGYEDYINEMGIRFLHEGIILIAENPEPVGFMKISSLPDGYAWLSAIRVHPDFRRVGIGNSLMHEALSRAEKMKAKGCRLMIENSNYRSKGLARKNRFMEVLDLLLFEGGFEISGMKESEPGTEDYISLGWEFCRYDPSMSKNVHKFMKNGSTVYHYETSRGNYQFISGPIDGEITESVLYTSIPYQDIPEGFPLRPVEEFRRAQVLELRI